MTTVKLYEIDKYGVMYVLLKAGNVIYRSSKESNVKKYKQLLQERDRVELSVSRIESELYRLRGSR